MKEGVPYADSRDVARVFGKEHKNVLQSIDGAHCSGDFRRLNFQPVTKYGKKNNKMQEITLYVRMTFIGFCFIALGWTGEKAGQFKEAYINKFEAMETALRGMAPKPEPKPAPSVLSPRHPDHTHRPEPG